MHSSPKERSEVIYTLIENLDQGRNIR